MRNSLYDNIIDEFLQHDINQEVSNLTEDIYSLVTSPMEEALSLTTSTIESVAPNILMAEAEKAAKKRLKNQKKNKKRYIEKKKTHAKQNNNRMKLCKHIMSVEFSLENRLNVVMKFPRIAELTASKLPFL